MLSTKYSTSITIPPKPDPVNMIGMPTNNDSVVSHVIALTLADVLVTSTSIFEREIFSLGLSGSGIISPEYSIM